MPAWLQVALSLVAPAAALIGVGLGSRLTASSAEAHWRRDRLLDFCAELIAAGQEASRESRKVADELAADPESQPPYPHEATEHLHRALGSVRLLSPGLADPAADYASAVIEVVDHSIKEDERAFVASIGRCSTTSSFTSHWGALQST